MLTYRPACRYRGARRYLHSTDLYGHLLEGLGECGAGVPTGAIRLVMRAITRHEVDIHYWHPNDPPGMPVSRPPMEFAIEANTGTINGYMTESERPVTTCAEYDEVAIRRLAVIDGDCVRMAGTPPNTAIEIVTSIAVALHNALLPPPAESKWLLGRIDLLRPLDDADRGGIEVCLAQRLGSRLTRSTVSVAGRPLGQLQFLLGTP